MPRGLRQIKQSLDSLVLVFSSEGREVTTVVTVVPHSVCRGCRVEKLLVVCGRSLRGTCVSIPAYFVFCPGPN